MGEPGRSCLKAMYRIRIPSLSYEVFLDPLYGIDLAASMTPGRPFGTPHQQIDIGNRLLEIMKRLGWYNSPAFIEH